MVCNHSFPTLQCPTSINNFNNSNFSGIACQLELDESHNSFIDFLCNDYLYNDVT